MDLSRAESLAARAGEARPWRLVATWLALSVGAALVYAPAAFAGGDQVASGSAQLNLSPRFKRQLKHHHVRLRPKQFTVTGGTIDPIGGNGWLTLKEKLKFQRGHRKRTFKQLIVTLGPRGDLRGGGRALFRLAGGEVRRDRFGTEINGIVVTLPLRAGKRLKRELGLRSLLKGPVGTLSISEQPQLLLQNGVSDEFAFDGHTFEQQPDPAIWAAESWSPRADHHWIAPDSSGNGILHLKSNCTGNCNSDVILSQEWELGGIKSNVTLTPPFLIGVRAKVSSMSTAFNAPLWLASPCVEIDVSEQLGRLPTTNWNVIHNWCPTNREVDISRDCGVLANGYHDYWANVTATKVDFSVDHNSACNSTITASDVGLSDFGGGFTVHSDELGGCRPFPHCQANPPPAEMLVDYIRTFRP